MLSVVLVEPESSGNVGAVARAMMNFGLEHLVIVNPKCDYLDLDAVSRARHAASILKKAVVVSRFSALNFDTLVAATSALGASSNVARVPLSPEQLSGKIHGTGHNVAIVFGRESTGLRNSEILKCDFVVTIPSSVRYRALNISHAAAVIFYVLFKRSRMRKIVSGYAPATLKEKAVIMEVIDSLLGRMPFHFDSQRVTQRKIWQRVIGKAMLSRREAFAVIGFLRKAGKQK
ncbi:MAG TPA: TrmJ/YjtD family RNA methyltransferase [Candidatus Nanoarchaeia archaeon]|nr:TrmJ/YjtD family RNA methyltransferase [Candidatus Nanoarchaeia archaeon]